MPKTYPVGEDEKVVRIMVYTIDALYWGDLVVKSQVRVSTWMRTNTAPDFFRLFDARLIYPGTGSQPQPLGFEELYVPTNQVLAYHLMPPLKEPLDYDPSEPNRRMEPVSIIAGTYRINGNMRLSTQSSLGKYIDITKEEFTPIYDADIINLITPSLGTVHAYFLLVRQHGVSFGITSKG